MLGSFPLVHALFQAAGFRVVYVTNEDLFMLVPDDEEKKVYGIPLFSIRAFERMESILSGGTHILPTKG